MIKLTMAIHYSKDKKTAAARTRLIISLLVGITAGVSVGLLIDAKLAPLLGWETAALTYLVWMWLTLHKLDNTLTKEFALREDPSRRVSEIILMLASLASLGAVLQVLLGSDRHSILPVGLGVLSVVLSWILVHTIFMLRYAEAYYREPHGSIEFPGTHRPTFRDFAYLAFTIGMTYQVSDTGFQSSELRGIALRHALLSYVFGTIIVATTINLIISLGSS